MNGGLFTTLPLRWKWRIKALASDCLGIKVLSTVVSCTAEDQGRRRASGLDQRGIGSGLGEHGITDCTSQVVRLG